MTDHREPSWTVWTKVEIRAVMKFVTVTRIWGSVYFRPEP